MIPIQPIILCGGSGTRLWPISTPYMPKQFIPLGNEGSSHSTNLLEQTLSRIKTIMKQLKSQGQIVLEPLLIMHKNHGEYYTGNNVIYEEYANDTAVAVARACNYLKNNLNNDLNNIKDMIMIVFPADHYIHQVDNFCQDIVAGINQVTDNNIVLYGIKPTYNETKYGYIIPTANGIKFHEKPSSVLANQLITVGALWNSGIFAARLSIVINSLNISSMNIWDWVHTSKEGKAASFDVAVLQEHKHIYAQISNDWEWSDVGSFDSFICIPNIIKEMNNNDNVVVHSSTNVQVLNRSPGNVVIIGCQDLLIVRNGDDLLIMSNKTDNNNQLKEIASKLY